MSCVVKGAIATTLAPSLASAEPSSDATFAYACAYRGGTDASPFCTLAKSALASTGTPLVVLTRLVSTAAYLCAGWSTTPRAGPTAASVCCFVSDRSSWYCPRHATRALAGSVASRSSRNTELPSATHAASPLGKLAGSRFAETGWPSASGGTDVSSTKKSAGATREKPSIFAISCDTNCAFCFTTASRPGSVMTLPFCR